LFEKQEEDPWVFIKQEQVDFIKESQEVLALLLSTQFLKIGQSQYSNSTAPKASCQR